MPTPQSSGVAKKNKLVRPGILGRGIRIVLGAATLSVTYGMVANLTGMFGGDLPLNEADFWISMILTFALTSWVVTETVQQEWGQRPLLVGLAALAVAAIAAFIVEGNFTGAIFTTTLWVWGFLLTLFLGVSLVVAGAVGQPGCEMRVYASLWARSKGKNADAVTCKGGIDRWDHIGSPDGK